jgi:hypothetical protein
MYSMRTTPRVHHTQARQVGIAERRKPDPRGRPGYLRVDTVPSRVVPHQRHRHGHPMAGGGLRRDHLREAPDSRVGSDAPSVPVFETGAPLSFHRRRNPSVVRSGNRNHHETRNRIGLPPAGEFRRRPPKRIADRYVQKSVCRGSVCVAALPIPSATLRFALASRGMAQSESAAMMTPGKLRFGASCRISEAVESLCRKPRRRSILRRSAMFCARFVDDGTGPYRGGGARVRRLQT